MVSIVFGPFLDAQELAETENRSRLYICSCQILHVRTNTQTHDFGWYTMGSGLGRVRSSGVSTVFVPFPDAQELAEIENRSRL